MRDIQTGNRERKLLEGPSDQNLVGDCEHEGGAPSTSENWNIKVKGGGGTSSLVLIDVIFIIL